MSESPDALLLSMLGGGGGGGEGGAEIILSSVSACHFPFGRLEE